MPRPRTPPLPPLPADPAGLSDSALVYEAQRIARRLRRMLPGNGQDLRDQLAALREEQRVRHAGRQQP